MEEIVLYTIGCPKCTILENALNKKNIKYITNTNVDEMRTLGFRQAPMLKVEGKFLDFNDAWRWVSQR